MTAVAAGYRIKGGQPPNPWGGSTYKPQDEQEIAAQGPPAGMVQNGRPLSIKSIDDLETRYYLRLTVADRPGVLAQISKILGDGGISLASVIQKDNDPAQQTAELVITTHPAREASVQKSVQQVSGLEVVTRINNLLRIEV